MSVAFILINVRLYNMFLYQAISVKRVGQAPLCVHSTPVTEPLARRRGSDADASEVEPLNVALGVVAPNLCVEVDWSGTVEG